MIARDTAVGVGRPIGAVVEPSTWSSPSRATKSVRLRIGVVAADDSFGWFGVRAWTGFEMSSRTSARRGRQPWEGNFIMMRAERVEVTTPESIGGFHKKEREESKVARSGRAAWEGSPTRQILIADFRMNSGTKKPALFRARAWGWKLIRSLSFCRTWRPCGVRLRSGCVCAGAGSWA